MSITSVKEEKIYELLEEPNTKLYETFYIDKLVPTRRPTNDQIDMQYVPSYKTYINMTVHKPYRHVMQIPEHISLSATDGAVWKVLYIKYEDAKKLLFTPRDADSELCCSYGGA